MEIHVFDRIGSCQGGKLFFNNLEIGNFSITFENSKPILRMIIVYSQYQGRGYGKKALKKISKYYNDELYTHKGASLFVIKNIVNKKTKNIEIEL